MNALLGAIFVKRTSWLSAVPVMLIFFGCAAVGPDYIRPDTPVSATWHTQLKGGLTAKEMNPKALAAWSALIRSLEADGHLWALTRRNN